MTWQEMMKKIDFKNYTVSGKGKKKRWEKGWQEILDNFVDKECDKKYLIPQYNRNGYPIRLFGDYVKSHDKEFENNFVELIRTFIFHKLWYS